MFCRAKDLRANQTLMSTRNILIKIDTVYFLGAIHFLRVLRLKIREEHHFYENFIATALLTDKFMAHMI